MKLIPFYFLFCCALTVFSEELTPSEILRRSNQVQNTTSFKAEMGSGKPGRPPMLYFHHGNSGKRPYTLMKSQNNTGMSFLTNDQGRFEIIGDTVIQEEDASQPQKKPQITRKDENTLIVNGNEITRETAGKETFAKLEKLTRINMNEPSKELPGLTMSEVTFEGIPCYRIEQKISTPLGTMNIEKMIDRKTFCQLRTRHFDGDGKLTTDLTYRKVEFDPVFAPGTFELPAGAKVYQPGTIKEKTDLLIKALDEKQPVSNVRGGSDKPLFARLANGFWNHIPLISGLTAGLAVAALATALLLKWKHRRN